MSKPIATSSIMALALFLAVEFLPPDAMAQPEDVAGWQSTYWGMPPQQLIEIYPEAKINEKGVYFLENVDIFGQPFSVHFLWTDKKLSGVMLTFDSDVYMPALGPRYESALRSKYGTPTVLEDSNKPYNCRSIQKEYFCSARIKKDLIFMFPSTEIEYLFNSSKMENNAIEFLEQFPSGVTQHTFLLIYYRPSQMDKL